MSGQHFSLRWNNHQSHVLSAFHELLQSESLVDCSLVCEDSNLKAHKVVLSACSPYFQKIFTDNPCRHPIIVLKDLHGWEVQCIIDFMYKGQTSVPESQLNSLLQAAESLQVKGLTGSADRRSLPPGLILEACSGAYSYGGMNCRRYSPYDLASPPQPKLPRPPPSHSSLALNHQDMPNRPRSPQGPPVPPDPVSPNTPQTSLEPRSPPGPPGPRRKQARPRRRSGDSVGNSSLDLSKTDSPPSCFQGGFGRKESPNRIDVDNTPENLSVKRQRSSSPAINLVKTESLLDSRPNSTSADLHSHPKVTISPSSFTAGPHSLPSPSPSCPPAIDHRRNSQQQQQQHYGELAKSAHFAAAARAAAVSAAAAAAVGMRHGVMEHEARVEALQALNFMASGRGMSPFPHPGLSSLHNSHGTHGIHGNHSSHHHGNQMLVRERSASTPGTPSSAYAGRGHKGQHSAPRGGPPRSWTNDDLTKALENVWNKRMTTSQASRVFGIPYNSLLMYVRGKYGKSLKLDVLKQKTPAANDNLNTIGNSRSTPKDKLASEKHLKQNGRRFDSSHTTSAYNPYAAVATAAAAAQHQQEAATAAMSSFPSSLFHNLPALQEHMGLLGILPHEGSRMRELMQSIHREQQSALNIAQANGDRSNDSIASHLNSIHSRHGLMSPPVGGLLMMPANGHGNSVSSDARSLSRSPMISELSMGSESAVDEDANEDVCPQDEQVGDESEDKDDDDGKETDLEVTKRAVEAILLEAKKQQQIECERDGLEDDKKNASLRKTDKFAADSYDEGMEVGDTPGIGVSNSLGGEIPAI